ncbi:helicase-related protein [Cohnella suwonensis]|uniref:Helicase-related protein n=1 Tax=Cohnella suwonensis TaxID=696072 RepID=A0ABW0LXN1_9BACL
MKVVLYALRKGSGKEAKISVAWEVDEGYWDGSGAEIARVKEALPLGIALALRDGLNAMWGSTGGEGDGQESIERDGGNEHSRRGDGDDGKRHGQWAMESDAGKEHSRRRDGHDGKRHGQRAMESDGGNEHSWRGDGDDGKRHGQRAMESDAGKERMWKEEVERVLRLCAERDGVLEGMAAELNGMEVMGGSGGKEVGTEPLADIHTVSGDEARSDRTKIRRARLARLAEAVREAAPALAGRALLREEAMQLLPRLLPAELAEESLAALQLASLAGTVRLTAAVAPEPHARPPLRGLRAWAERLRSARLPGLATPASPRRARPELRCRRCGSGSEALRRTPCAACGRQACAYCAACLTMGRSRECGLLVIGAPAGLPAPRQAAAPADRETLSRRWGLSPAQAAAAGKALTFLAERLTFDAPAASSTPSALPYEFPATSNSHASFALPDASTSPASFAQPDDSNSHASFALPNVSTSPASFALPDASTSPAPLIPSPAGASATTSPNDRSFLLWAVTGAGKTEMIFPLLAFVISRGGRALVATPRKDVVLELAPRLAKAFPDATPVVLYGGSEQRWETGALTLATTHQLFRFQEAFDLVLIDELDAFPYHNDPMLHHAAEKCRRLLGVTVYLSATPPSRMQREVTRGKLPCARVPVRYHGHPLPVPGRVTVPRLADLLKRRQLPSKLLKQLRISSRRGAQLFLFVPFIKQVESLVSLLRRYADQLGLPPETIAGTSSKDGERTDKVTDFRSGKIRALVTTTILERGITIPKSDVYVFDSDHAMFDASSLVQMAGRAGRSAADPGGVVRFVAPLWTNSQRDAVRQIRTMNSLAAREGYLKFPN